MMLFHSSGSPFGRKVLGCAFARGIEARITLVPMTGEHPELIPANPLGKLPCMVTDDGTALFDSRVICEFLDMVGDAAPMFPADGRRIGVLKLQAIGDGIADALMLRRAEERRPREAARDGAIATQTAKAWRSLALLESAVPDDVLDVGTIAVLASLGYLDLRFAHEPWRPAHPRLAAWFAAMMRYPAMIHALPQ